MSRHFGGIGHNRQADKAKVFVVLTVFVLTVSLAVAFVFMSNAPENVTASTVVEKREPDEPQIRRVNVLVSIDKIDQGMPLEASMFRVEQRPEVGLPPGVVRDYEEIRYHYSKITLPPGEPLRRDDITESRPINSVIARIPEGHRAVTINVNATSSVEGWARPGAKVDVVWVSKIRGEQSISVIAQNAEVLSAERQIDPSQAKPGAPVPSTVTLLVTAADAQKIQLAQTTGSLSLALRGDRDEKGINNPVITLNDLIGGGGDGSKDVAACQGTVTIGNSKFCLKPGGKLELAQD